MKKLLSAAALFATLLMLVQLAGCGTASAVETTAAVTAVPGENIVKSWCTVLLPAGWTKVDFDDSRAIHLIKDISAGTFIAVSVFGDNVTAEENEALFRSQMKFYGASWNDDRVIGGADCLCATYTDDGRTIVQYQGVDADGTQLSVQLYDLDPADEVVAAVLDSLTF